MYIFYLFKSKGKYLHSSLLFPAIILEIFDEIFDEIFAGKCSFSVGASQDARV
jgi:hypothetical protein